mmetsp:Transcript_26689/g.67240  ORF Transcript_26689/g.67240 Transcript_26689/m.67240 type:complete len:550 (+) Transcript_26689:95-1744(+)|eukprot:CAMPEP_0178991638 /NCGR_PEP_ID=MMETSP0795-20121207/5644_1 /TAXON_ID=88552 /ORGANISM="Amoebophrya sp., Strain Ameob2" /LENGTH=549 /DNA_ID=CAMNT_0020683379 /DNA_START=145 /DNA_END=1794 /DNA_ORIENTATION=-
MGVLVPFLECEMGGWPHNRNLATSTCAAPLWSGTSYADLWSGTSSSSSSGAGRTARPMSMSSGGGGIRRGAASTSFFDLGGGHAQGGRARRSRANVRARFRLSGCTSFHHVPGGPPVHDGMTAALNDVGTNKKSRLVHDGGNRSTTNKNNPSSSTSSPVHNTSAELLAPSGAKASASSFLDGKSLVDLRHDIHLKNLAWAAASSASSSEPPAEQMSGLHQLFKPAAASSILRKMSGSALRSSFLSVAQQYGVMGGFYAVGVLYYGLTPHEWWSDNYFPAEGGKPGILDCIVQGMYYATQVLTTIGYGDVVPSGELTKAFDIFYLIAGVGVAGTLVLGVITDAVGDRIKDLERRQLQETLAAEESPDGERVDSLKRRMELAEGILLMVVPTLVGALTYGIVHKWPVVGSLHWAVVTNSTVGFGASGFDISNRVMRMFSVLYMNVGCACFATGLGKVVALLEDVHGDSSAEGSGGGSFNADAFTLEQALGMDQDGDKKVDKFEFATGCLLASGKLSETELRQIMNRFRQLDTDRSGLLTIDDLPKNKEAPA